MNNPIQIFNDLFKVYLKYINSGLPFFHEEFNRPRKQAAWVVTVIASVVCIFCSLSVGAYKGLTILGMSIMDFLDYLTAQYLMPCGALLTCLYVGWYIGVYQRWSVAQSLLPLVYVYCAFCLSDIHSTHLLTSVRTYLILQ